MSHAAHCAKRCHRWRFYCLSYPRSRCSVLSKCRRNQYRRTIPILGNSMSDGSDSWTTKCLAQYLVGSNDWLLRCFRWSTRCSVRGFHLLLPQSSYISTNGWGCSLWCDWWWLRHVGRQAIVDNHKQIECTKMQKGTNHSSRHEPMVNYVYVIL